MFYYSTRFYILLFVLFKNKNNNEVADIEEILNSIGKEGQIYNQDDFLGKPFITIFFFGLALVQIFVPYGLTIISEVLDDLEADKNKFNSVFVTLDPERMIMLKKLQILLIYFILILLVCPAVLSR